MVLIVNIIGLSIGAVLIFLGFTKKFHPIIRDNVEIEQAQIIFITLGLIIMMVFGAMLINGV